MDSTTDLKRNASDLSEEPSSDGDLREEEDRSPDLVSAPNSLTDLSAASAASGTGSPPKPNMSFNINKGTSPAPIKRKKNSSKGRHGDPRMHRAVAARLLNPELSLLESLLEGGFTFPEGTEGSGKSDRNIYDSDGVLLCQRKNQLSRRLRLAKKRQQASRAEGGVFASGVGNQDDSRTIQNMLLNGQLPVPGSEVPMHHNTNQFGRAFFPAQVPSKLDPSTMQGNDSRQMKKQRMDNNLDQYFQLAVGIRPDQLQALRYSGNMFPGFPAGAIPFQQFAIPQQPQNFLGAIDPQTAGLNPGMNLHNMQNIQMPPMMAMPTNGNAGQPQMNTDLSQFLLNRSMFMNSGEGQDESGQNS